MTEALAIWKKTADGKSSLGQLVGDPQILLDGPMCDHYFIVS